MKDSGFESFIRKAKQRLVEHDWDRHRSLDLENAMQIQVELDLQRSVQTTLASLHDNDKQDFIRMYHISYGLTLLTFPK